MGVFWNRYSLNQLCNQQYLFKRCGRQKPYSDKYSGVITGNNKGTINYGDKVSGDKVTAETINHEEYKDNSRKIELEHGNYIETKVIQKPPSFRDVAIAQGDNGNPVGVADNPSPIQNATELLGKLMRGEEVKLQGASPSKFLINSGTEISILESDSSSEKAPTGFLDPIGFTQFVKIKILEGPHKGKTGWIHAGTIHHEQRQK